MAEIKLSVSNEEVGKKKILIGLLVMTWSFFILLTTICNVWFAKCNPLYEVPFSIDLVTDSAEVACSDTREGLYLRYTNKQLRDYEVAANL